MGRMYDLLCTVQDRASDRQDALDIQSSQGADNTGGLQSIGDALDASNMRNAQDSTHSQSVQNGGTSQDIQGTDDIKDKQKARDNRTPEQQLFIILKHSALYYLRRYEYCFFRKKTTETSEKESLSIPDDDINAAVNEFQKRIIRNWDRDTKDISDEGCWQYINKWMKGSMRKFYCKYTKVTPYYMEYMESLHKNGLDLWTSDETDLIKFIENPERRHPKNPKLLLIKLRSLFPDLESDAPKREFLPFNALVKKVSDELGVKTATAKYLIAMDSKEMYPGKTGDEELKEYLSDYLCKPDRMVYRLKRDLEDVDVEKYFSELHEKYSFPEGVNEHKIDEKIKDQISEIENKLDINESDLAAAAVFLQEKLSLRPAKARVLAAILSQTSLDNTDTVYLCAIVQKANPKIKNPVGYIERLRKCSVEIKDLEKTFNEFKQLYDEGRTDPDDNIKNPQAPQLDYSLEGKDIILEIEEKGAISKIAAEKRLSMYYAKFLLLLEANGISIETDSDESICEVIRIIYPKRKNPERLLANLKKALNHQDLIA